MLLIPPIYPQVVSKFAKDDVDGVLKRANDTEFGLASGVFTNDISKVLSCYLLISNTVTDLFAKCFFPGALRLGAHRRRHLLRQHL